MHDTASQLLKRLEKRAKKGARGYPVGTLAFYGPDDRRASKMVAAIVEREGIAVVQPERCIGCGLCVTGCPEQAVALSRKPEAQTIHPPADFAAWEKARLANRWRV